MPSRVKTDTVFDAKIMPDGTLRLSRDARQVLQRFRGETVRVRISSRELAEELRERGVTEEEIDRIRKVQMDEWENVARCLLAEGGLTGFPEFRASSKKGRWTV